tara:strand:+ start:999 stop:1253 length:255 start_codon:yes stop_codon:yes gene_type:complete
MRLFLCLIFLIAPNLALAHPIFFEQYKEHPRALEKADCSICHFDPNGGGKLQQFGLDFAQAEYNITKKMLEQYPDRFKQKDLTK